MCETKKERKKMKPLSQLGTRFFFCVCVYPRNCRVNTLESMWIVCRSKHDKRKKKDKVASSLPLEATLFVLYLVVQICFVALKHKQAKRENNDKD